MDYTTTIRSNQVTVGDLKREAQALKRALRKETVRKQKLEKLMLEVHSLRDKVHALRHENNKTQKSIYENGLSSTIHGDFRE